jgi:hypothetical protein
MKKVNRKSIERVFKILNDLSKEIEDQKPKLDEIKDFETVGSGDYDAIVDSIDCINDSINSLKEANDYLLLIPSE